MKRTSRLSLVVVVALSATLVAGCEGLNTLATGPDAEKTRRGAGYGAAAGAAIGLLTKGNKFENALIGAAIGGLAGGAIGNYQDRQERQLREQLAGTGVEVVRQSENIVLDMPGGVTFRTDSSELSPEAKSLLDKVSSTLVEYNQTMIEVAGHTDSTGRPEYNQSLSERRAQSVATHLSSRGVPQPRMIIVGGGQNHPVASNDTPEGRAQNRRVEITIVPVEKRG